MEKLSPLQMLDAALKYLKDPSIQQKNFSTLLTFLNLKGYKYSENDLKRIVQKLIDDKYIYKDDGGFYKLTFEGFYFIGYEKQFNHENVLTSRKNIRDFFLTWGTVLAGIAASLLLVWQIYSYFHPVPSPCDVIEKVKTK